jgi:anti-sigma factor RsiW
MKATCLIVRAAAPTADLSGLSPRLESHVTACLYCQAEMARYGRLRRRLASLADVVEPVPAPLAAGVNIAIASGELPSGPVVSHSHPARVAAAAGAVVAAAAGAAAVAMWRHSKAVV